MNNLSRWLIIFLGVAIMIIGPYLLQSLYQCEVCGQDANYIGWHCFCDEPNTRRSQIRKSQDWGGIMPA